jgi:inositol transport system substrate-binding protein
MKTTLVVAGFAPLMGTSAMAEGIGVSIAKSDDNFLTVLRNGIDATATEPGVSVQIEDAQNDVAKPLDQINNFIASGVTAIIVNPVDTSATQAMSDAAAAAGVPLVCVNRQPVNVDTLPDNQAFVTSNEVDCGTLETIEVCAQLKAAGKDKANVHVMMAELSNQAAVQRTADIHDVMAAGTCAVEPTIVDEQTANWSRDEARNMMTNWLPTGAAFDGVIANNDEMAIGATQAMKAAGIDMATVMVGGIDATQDPLAASQAGALDAAIKLSKREAVEQKVYIPFDLVTAANVADCAAKNGSFGMLGRLIIGESVLFNTREGTDWLFNAQRLSIIILQVATVGVLAIGVTQMTITGGIDLSSGPVLGATAMVAMSSAKTAPGISLQGGRGSVIGTLIGALIFGVIIWGFTFLNLDAYYQEMVKGVIIIGAVVLDQWRQKSRARS